MKLFLKRNQKGQSTIEFVITFGFSIGITFLFLGMAINYVVGYLVHYATYMSSRTYLVHDASRNATTNTLSLAESAAREKYSKYNLDAFDVGVNKININNPEEVRPLFAGVTTTYKRKVSFVKFVSGSKDATLLSESLLGKEPLRIECLQSICKAMGGGEACSQSMDVTLYDNGC